MKTGASTRARFCGACKWLLELRYISFQVTTSSFSRNLLTLPVSYSFSLNLFVSMFLSISLFVSVYLSFIVSISVYDSQSLIYLSAESIPWEFSWLKSSGDNRWCNSGLARLSSECWGTHMIYGSANWPSDIAPAHGEVTQLPGCIKLKSNTFSLFLTHKALTLVLLRYSSRMAYYEG